MDDKLPVVPAVTSGEVQASIKLTREQGAAEAARIAGCLGELAQAYRGRPGVLA